MWKSTLAVALVAAALLLSRPAAAQLTQIPCIQVGGYPWAQNACINAADLNNAFNLSISGSPPTNLYNSGASLGKMWLDVSVGPPALRICNVSGSGLCSPTYNSAQWLLAGYIDFANNEPIWPIGGGIATLIGSTLTDLSTVAADYVTITGNATINFFGTLPLGQMKLLKFTGAATLVNSASIIIPGGSNYTTTPGFFVWAVSRGGNVWEVIPPGASAMGGGGGGGTSCGSSGIAGQDCVSTGGSGAAWGQEIIGAAATVSGNPGATTLIQGGLGDGSGAGGGVNIYGGLDGGSGTAGSVVAAGGTDRSQDADLEIDGADAASGAPGAFFLFGGSAVTSSNGAGPLSQIVGAQGNGSGGGGDLQISAGAGGASANGGSLSITGGAAGNTGSVIGGSIDIASADAINGGTSGALSLNTAGTSTTGISGDITIGTGEGVTNTGSVFISTGNNNGTGHAGGISLTTGNDNSTSGAANNSISIMTGSGAAAPSSNTVGNNINIQTGDGFGAILIGYDNATHPPLIGSIQLSPSQSILFGGHISNYTWGVPDASAAAGPGAGGNPTVTCSVGSGSVSGVNGTDVLGYFDIATPGFQKCTIRFGASWNAYGSATASYVVCVANLEKVGFTVTIPVPTQTSVEFDFGSTTTGAAAAYFGHIWYHCLGDNP